MTVTILEGNVAEFEVTFVDVDNDNAPVNPATVTFQPSLPGVFNTVPGDIFTWDGHTTAPGIDVIGNSTNPGTFRCRVAMPLNNPGVVWGKWVATGTGAAEVIQNVINKGGPY